MDISDNIVCFSDLDEEEKREAIEVFIEGFGHMFTFAKTKNELTQFFTGAFEEPLMYACVSENHVAGILGLGTNVKRAIKLDQQKCMKLFGKSKGGMVYKLLHIIAGKPAVKNADDLYIDYLATDSRMRKRGVGTKLLNFAFSLPQYKVYYIEVLSKNQTAAKLYEQLGFTVHKKKFNILTITQGLGNPIIMKKEMR